MAGPIVAGAAALLRERHPGLVGGAAQVGARPTTAARTRRATPVTRQGGGVIDLPLADDPIVFASPPRSRSASSGAAAASRGRHARRRGRRRRRLDGDPRPDDGPEGREGHAREPSVTVPGRLTLRVATTKAAAQGDVSGRVVLTRGADVRRLTFWLHVTAPALPAPTRTIAVAGLYKGATKGRPARVTRYRYPIARRRRVRDDPPRAGAGLPRPDPSLRGQHGRRGRAPRPRRHRRARIVAAGDENRLTGLTALPVDVNPYGRTYGGSCRAAGAIAPRPGSTTWSSTAAARRRRLVHVPALDRRPDTAVRSHCRAGTSASGRSARRLRPRRRQRGHPRTLVVSVDGRTRATPSLAAADPRATGVAAGRHALVVDAPTTRSRGTWRRARRVAEHAGTAARHLRSSGRSSVHGRAPRSSAVASRSRRTLSSKSSPSGGSASSERITRRLALRR